MAVAAWKVLAVVFVVAVSLGGGGGVSAQTHHVIGGGPDFNVTAWLQGRFFIVGDKIRGDESMVEVRGPEEMVSCDVTNPIKMYTEAETVTLEEEGVRYFTASNPESCRNGLKLSVPVVNRHDHEYKPDVPYPPYEPDVPSPHKPDVPYPPYEPDVPSPPHRPDVPYPPSPSAAASHKAVIFVFAVSVLSIHYLI